MIFFAKYCMNLYSLDKKDFVSWLPQLPDGIELVDATEKLFDENKAYCAKHYRRWKSNMKKGAKCVFAVHNNRIVGHGWLKTQGSNDTFYKFGRKVAYLSEFYVDGDFRGRGIYPVLQSYLIHENPEYQRFFSSAYPTNVSSLKGLKKVGFSKISTLTFYRAFKITWNKYALVEKQDT